MEEEFKTYLFTHFINDPGDKNEKLLTMKYSIIERIITKLVFLKETKFYSLYHLFLNLKEQHDGNREKYKEDYISLLKSLKSKLFEIEVLNFYCTVLQEVLNYAGGVHREVDTYNSFPIEYILATHIANNFFYVSNKSHKKIDDIYFNDNFVRQATESTNYQYSVTSITTMFKILQVLETQSYKSKFSENPDIKDGFISNKVNQILNPQTSSENLIDYLIMNMEATVGNLYDKQEKYNNYEIENIVSLYLFLIHKIIKDYSFYLDKSEIKKIFLSVEKYKNWPLPVGHFGMELFELLVNELYLQGITLANQIRETYFIDLINPKTSMIDIETFVSATLVFSEDSIRPIMDDFCIKSKKRIVIKEQKLNLKYFLIKLFLLLVTNNDQKKPNLTTLDNIIKRFTNYDISTNVPATKMEEEEDIEGNEDGVKINQEEPKGTKESIEEDNTKPCLDHLFKIIDSSLDMTYDVFIENISQINNWLLGTVSESGQTTCEVENTPITEYRTFLKPLYEKRKQGLLDANDNEFDIYDLYKSKFHTAFETYFSHLKPETGIESSGSNANSFISENSNEIKSENKIMDLYHKFKVNIVLIEDARAMKNFLDHLYITYRTLPSKISDEDFKIWNMFIKTKDELKMKFKLYLVPHYNSIKENPFRYPSKNENYENDPCYVSEFIATKDYIYKNMVFLPWVAINDSESSDSYSNFDQEQKKDKYNLFYSFLREPLNLYLTDAKGTLNLNIYKYEFEGETKSSRLFWKSFDFVMEKSGKMENRLKKDNTAPLVCTATLTCVDLFACEGCEEEEKTFVLSFHDTFQIKLFNIFFKKNAPFNYSMNSNNGWLEAFVCENYNKSEIEKINNFKHVQQTTTSKISYFEEFVIPQMEMDSIYKNYKVKKMVIEPQSSGYIIKVDDSMEPLEQTDNARIIISPYERLGEHVSIEVATFTPI